MKTTRECFTCIVWTGESWLIIMASIGYGVTDGQTENKNSLYNYSEAKNEKTANVNLENDKIS